MTSDVFKSWNRLKPYVTVNDERYMSTKIVRGFSGVKGRGFLECYLLHVMSATVSGTLTFRTKLQPKNKLFDL